MLDKYFITKQPLTTSQVEEAVSRILISFKAGKKIAAKSRNIYKIKGGTAIQTGVVVPRGPLSEESVYGKIVIANEVKPLKFLFENPHLILKPHIKNLVEERLARFDGDKKKALSSVKKEPIYLRGNSELVLEWARCYSEQCVIKYNVNGDFNKVDKVVDNGVKSILQTRLAKFNGRPKEAFKEVVTETGETVAWWQDEGLRHPIISVRCLTGLSAIVPIKKDENGNNIGFVKPENNHHVAIYIDPDGKREEHIVTFWHAVERKKYGVPVIISRPDRVWDSLPQDLPDDFLNQLPDPTWTFEESLQQNEMFVLGMESEAFDEAIYNKDYALLSKYLYRVQRLSSSDYYFRHHLETKVDDKYQEEKNEKLSVSARKMMRIKSVNTFASQNPKKIKISLLGEIVETK